VVLLWELMSSRGAIFEAETGFELETIEREIGELIEYLKGELMRLDLLKQSEPSNDNQNNQGEIKCCTTAL